MMSHSKDGDTPAAVDLGWKVPEKKRGKKKDAGAKTVDATDSTDASERREAAKVRLSSLSNTAVLSEKCRPIEHGC
jgi:hypothetical protein